MSSPPNNEGIPDNNRMAGMPLSAGRDVVEEDMPMMRRGLQRRRKDLSCHGVDASCNKLFALGAVAVMNRGPSVFESRSHVGPSFGKAPPVGISRAVPKGSLYVKKEWSGASSAAVWNVKTQDLQELPDFPLERTHRKISGSSAPEVSSRISNALRELSVEAEFDCEKAKAKCKTEDYVSFRIRLYAGGVNGDPVVVEVQKRCGSSSTFMRTCRAILDAAEGKDAFEVANKATALPSFMTQPVSQMKCLQGVVNTSDEEGRIALEGVVNMLRSSKPDQNILGLEELCALTDPIKTAPNVALQISKNIVLSDQVYDIREEIRVLTERDVFTLGFEHEAASRHMDQLRHLALSVLSNALSLCSKDGCLSSAIREQRWFAEHLIPSLVDELKRAASSTCNAYHAVCCIFSLITCSEHARRLVLECGGLETMQEAYAYGQPRHALLAEEAHRCIKALEG